MKTLKVHVQQQHDPSHTTLQCSACDNFRGKSEFALKRHVYSKHEALFRESGLPVFPCPSCKKVYFTEGGLAVHSKKHPAEKAFFMWGGVCSPCGSSPLQTSSYRDDPTSCHKEEDEYDGEEDEEHGDDAPTSFSRLHAEVPQLGIWGPRSAWVPIPTTSKPPEMPRIEGMDEPRAGAGAGVETTPKRRGKKRGIASKNGGAYFPCGVMAEDGMRCPQVYKTLQALEIHAKREHHANLPVLQPLKRPTVVVRAPWNVRRPAPTDLIRGYMFLCTACNFVMGGDSDLLQGAMREHTESAHKGVSMRDCWESVDSKIWWCPSPFCDYTTTKNQHSHGKTCRYRHDMACSLLVEQDDIPCPSVFVMLYQCMGEHCSRLDKTVTVSLEHQFKSRKPHVGIESEETCV